MTAKGPSDDIASGASFYVTSLHVLDVSGPPDVRPLVDQLFG